MRIGIATWSRRLAGGVESYLADVVPALLERGHDLAVLHEVDEPADRAPIVTRAAVPHFSAAGARDQAVAGLAAWKPDVIYAHGLDDPSLERRVLALAPTVLFAHAYRGTCISGTRSFAAFANTTCHHALGWQCLARYFPNRCGGLNPVTMVRLYRQESHRRDTFGEYAAVVMFSRHVQAEYVRNGVPEDRTFRLPCHVPSIRGVRPRGAAGGPPSRLLFAGRMEPLKGGHVLLETLPAVQNALGRALDVVFAGDGRLRSQWQSEAERLFPPGAPVHVTFTGWIAPDQLQQRFAVADLLVVPSLWPEPFGLIGLEAAAFGVPAAAFDVGGIGEWLRDGYNGHLAQADPPRPESLAAAIVRCLRDPQAYAALSRGAIEVASRHSMDAHLASLLDVLTAASLTGRRGIDDPAA